MGCEVNEKALTSNDGKVGQKNIYETWRSAAEGSMPEQMCDGLFLFD